MDKNKLRIIFFGTPEFAVESLRLLVDGRFNIVGVVTMPDKPAGRGHKLYQSPVKEYALQHNLKLLQPINLKDSTFIDELRYLDANLFIVIAFRMLPEVVWQMPSLGTFNLHASLLPKYRGAAPINWAIINGDTETGVTTFFLKHEIDTGDIIDREKIDILPADNCGTIHDKLMYLGARLTLKTVNNILNGSVCTIPQSSVELGTVPSLAPKIFKETCRIDWNKSAREIHNFVRGLSPYPGAWTDIMFDDNQSMTIKIFETRLTDRLSESPSMIHIDRGHIFIDCLDYSLEIILLQPQGKKKMSATDYTRGLRNNVLNAF